MSTRLKKMDMTDFLTDPSYQKLMYYYKIENADGECSSKKILMHAKEFTPDEFHAIMQEVVIAAIQLKHARNQHEFREYYEEEPVDSFRQVMHAPSTFEDIRDDVIEILCHDHQFERLPITQQFKCWGNVGLLDDSEWYEWRQDDPLVPIMKKIVESGLGKEIADQYDR
jgi:hypothetical protein